MTESFISRPALLIDLPEPKSIESKFNYNFFTSDERVNESSNVYGDGGFASTNTALNTENISTTNVTDDSLRLFYGRNSIFPRYVKISIEKPNIAIAFDTKLQNAINRNEITRETASNVFGRVGVSIIDTALDRTIYNTLSGSVSQTSSNENESASLRIIDAIKNSIQPNGYRYTETGNREGVINPIEKVLQGLDYGFSYLPNTAGTITEASLNSSKNIYADEISSTSVALRNVEQQAIATSQPYLLRTGDYEASLKYIDEEVAWEERSKNVLVGYILQKFGINLDGTTNIYDERIILNPNITSFLDANVAYGKSYKYRVIAIYACMFQLNERTATDSGSEEDRVITKYSIFASRGVDTSVICEELIAPSPPVDLKFRYRADNTGLNITWNFPVNLQRDIKKFQVFRRRTTADPFQLIGVYDFDDSVIKTQDIENVPNRLITRSLFPTTIHKDTEFTKNSRFIYAICAIDAHGFTSNYSVQLEASYDRYRNRINTRIISSSNAPKPYPNIFLNRDTFVDTMKMSGYTRLNIYFDPEYIQITNQDGVSQNHVVFAGTSGDDNSYKLMIVNTDFQQSQTLDIKINDSYVQPPVITPSTARVFSPT